MPTYLNELVLSTNDEETTDRNAVKVAIDPKTKGIDGIEVREPKSRPFWRRMMGRTEHEWVLVHTARAVDVADIVVENEDVSTDIRFRLSLKLSLEVPEASDVDGLKRMVNAFRNATLETYGKPTSGQQPKRAPQRMFETELQQWMKRRYNSGRTISEHEDPIWNTRQANEIQAHIRQEYGLKALARLTIEFPSPLNLGPLRFEVSTSAKDSPKPIKVNLRAGCRLQGQDPFTASPLSESRFQKRITDVIDRYMRDNVSLHQFRFSDDWFAGLESAIKRSLQAVGREATDIHYDFVRDSGGYRERDYSVAAKDARFVPAGWDAKDAILFSAQADIEIKNAALFEQSLRDDDLLKTEQSLKSWLETSMQTAVNTCLHEVHRTENGYAYLLTNWTKKFRGAIEAKLIAMAKEAGIHAKTIVTQPDRPEMRLLEGVEVELGDFSLPLRQDAGTIDLFGSAVIKTDSFEAIKDILNSSKTPLEYVKNEIILPALAKSSRNIDYNTFSKSFDTSVIETFTSDLKEALCDRNLKLVSVALDAKQTEQQLVLKRLLSEPSQPVKFHVPPRVLKTQTGQIVSPEFNVTFQLQITGVDFEGQIDRFLGYNWSEKVSEHGSEYASIVNSVGDNLGSGLTGQDVPTLLFANSTDARQRKHFEKRIIDELNTYLKSEYGLTGFAIAIKSEVIDDVAVIQNQEDKITQIEGIRAEGEAKRAEIAAAKEARKEIAERRADIQARLKGTDDSVDATDIGRLVKQNPSASPYAEFALPDLSDDEDAADGEVNESEDDRGAENDLRN